MFCSMVGCGLLGLITTLSFNVGIKVKYSVVVIMMIRFITTLMVAYLPPRFFMNFFCPAFITAKAIINMAIIFNSNATDLLVNKLVANNTKVYIIAALRLRAIVQSVNLFNLFNFVSIFGV